MVEKVMMGSSYRSSSRDRRREEKKKQKENEKGGSGGGAGKKSKGAAAVARLEREHSKIADLVVLASRDPASNVRASKLLEDSKVMKSNHDEQQAQISRELAEMRSLVKIINEV